MLVDELIQKARWVRRQALEMIVAAGKGHIGGAYSCTDILVTLYYGGILRFNPHDPGWRERDRFILSKGHSCAALYAVLADVGYFDVSELKTFCQRGSRLGGHPDKNIPGIEVNSGSLGHGLGIGAGLALSARMDQKKNLTFVLLGDGECYEGSVWEAAMFTGHHRLNNLVAIVDRNQQCVTDFTEDCNRLDPLADKWKSFGWEVKSLDGHSFDELLNALKTIRSRTAPRPLAVIANTVKGKGVSFMEKKLAWHHSVPTGDELIKARQELGG